MSDPLDVLNAHTWVRFNPALKGFNKPGVVLLCLDKGSKAPGERSYQPLDVYDAKNDAAAVASSLIKQKKHPFDEVYAEILLSDDASLRTSICSQLATICSGGK